MQRKNLWRVIAALEVIAAAVVILLDLFIPTLIILGMVVISLLVRGEGPASLGFRKGQLTFGMVGFILLSVLVWQLLAIGLFLPVLNRLAGTTQDLSAYSDMKGNLGQLALYLALSWTLAALGEETVYRGYLQKRLGDLFGSNTLGLVLTVGISSLLFGLAHTEQGLIGVAITTLDALFFTWLKMRHKNLWAAVLAHGFSNSVGLIVFFCVGPLYGLW